MRLRQFAEVLGVSYSTALRMFRRNEIPGAYKLPSGTIVIPDSAIGVLEGSNPVSDGNLMDVMEVIESASVEVLGPEDGQDLMQLIHRVLTEYWDVVTNDGD